MNRIRHNGFSFIRDARHYDGVGRRYICTHAVNQRRCPAKLWILTTGETVLLGHHDHVMPPVDPPLAAINAGIQQVPRRRRIIHLRHRRLPIPTVFTELHEYFLMNRKTEGTYLGRVESNTATAFLFGTKNFINELGEFADWHVDMTYQCVPLMPTSSLLLTIILQRGNEGFPALFVLCSEKSASLFIAIWEWIQDQSPSVSTVLKEFICDCDGILLMSVHESFPTVRCKGTWLTFARAMYRKWSSLKLPDRSKSLSKIFYFCCALPFVPPHLVNEAIDILTIMLDAHELESTNFNSLREFLRTSVALQAENFLVCYSPSMCAALAEDFNKCLLKIIGELHPSMTTFVEKIPQIIKQCSTKMAKEASTTRELNRTVQTLIERLQSGGCGLRDFLQIIGYSRQNIQALINAALDRPLYRFDNFSEIVSQIDRLGVHRAIVPDPVDVPVAVVVPGLADIEPGDGGNPGDGSNPTNGGGGDLADGGGVANPPVPVPVVVPGLANIEPGDGGNPEDGDNPENGGGAANPPVPDPANADVDDILAGDFYFQGEIQLLDEPTEQPWIHEATTNMNFDDEQPPENEEPCCLCHKNARKMAFTPCGHRCLCHECTFKFKKFAERQNRHRAHYQIKCVLCLIPSTSIVYVRN